MGNRLAQILLLLAGLVFAFAVLDALTEPWGAMNEAYVVKTICGHLIALVLCILSFRSALHFGSKADDSTSQIQQPNL